jgi:uncharacterized membrane protein YkvA (DUF1232 family)
MELALIVLAGIVVVWLACVAGLVVAGRRSEARALAGFVPDCVVLVRRLLGDPRVPRRRKAMLGLLVAYLALPFDLVPDVIPVAGQLDDAILLALVLRGLVRGGGRALVVEHWPGPEASLRILLRLAGAP